MQFEDFEEDLDVLLSESEVIAPFGLELKYCTEHGIFHSPLLGSSCRMSMKLWWGA